MYSSITIAGMIIDEPKKHYDDDGRPVTVFTVVDQQTRRDRVTKELKTFSRQFEIRATGQEAESVFKIAKKGDKILTEGHPSLWTWTTSRGMARGIIVCTTDTVRFIDRQEKEGQNDETRNTQEQTDDDQLPELQGAGQGRR